MEPLKTIRSHVVPLPAKHVDTDQIIPARFLKVTDKVGLGKVLFHDWSHREDGSLNTDFVLNRPEARGAQVLLAGDNFGCGSSREHAPWALVDWGFRAVISTSFADIFRNNSLKNGLLPIVVSEPVHRGLFEQIERDPKVEVAVDLEKRELRLPDGNAVSFPVDEFARHCLLNGIDELGYLLSLDAQIVAYEQGSP